MEMEAVASSGAKDYRSSVDTSRPFRSVKEAVAIFGERILVGEIYSPKPFYTPPSSKETASWVFSPQSPSKEDDIHEDRQNEVVLDALKKLEAELEETKVELKMLKERESETEVALASLNAELHKNMSKLAAAEAAAAKKANFEREGKVDVLREEERRRELMKRMENSRTLAQILKLSEEKTCGGSNYKKERMKMMKKKPIVPLVSDLFFRKKNSTNPNHDNPLPASSQVYFN